MSHELVRRGVDHVVVEREDVASSWLNQRGDAFRLNTSDWMNGKLTAHPVNALNSAAPRFTVGSSSAQG